MWSLKNKGEYLVEILVALQNELARNSNLTVRRILKTFINYIKISPLSEQDSIEDQELFINKCLHESMINADTVAMHTGQSTSIEIKTLDYISRFVQDVFTKMKLDIVNNNPPKVTMEECVDYSLERLT